MIESIIELKEYAERKVTPTNIKLKIEILEGNNPQSYIKEKADKVEKEILDILKEKEIGSQEIIVSDSSIPHNKTNKGEQNYQVYKRITVDLETDIVYLNQIIDALLALDTPPALSWEGYIKNIEEIDRELLTEAITKSKDKANHIASVLGKRVLGVKKISNNCSSMAAVASRGCGETLVENACIQIQEQTIYVEVFSEWYI